MAENKRTFESVKNNSNLVDEDLQLLLDAEAFVKGEKDEVK